MSVNKLLNELSSAEISEWMAFDQLKDANYKDKLKAELMTEEERNQALKAMLGYKTE